MSANLHIKYLYPWFLLLTFSFFAQSNNASELRKTIDNTCIHSSYDCLKNIKYLLANTQQNSRMWFKYKLLQMDALYILQNDTTLLEITNYWLDKTNAPVIFQVYVQIYKAKLSLAIGKNIDGNKYLSKAVKLLSLINDSIPKPMRLIEIANLLYVNNRIEEARATLLNLEKIYAKRNVPLFNRELYGNLGHIAGKSKQFKLQLDYRKKALFWALEYKNEQQIGIVYYNLARAQQTLKQYADAEKSYKMALKFSIKSHDKITQLGSQLRVVEVMYQQNKKQTAQKLFASLSQKNFTTSTPKEIIKRYFDLKEILASNRQ